MKLKSVQNLKNKLISCFKNDKNMVKFDRSTKSLKNFQFDWFLLCKIYNVWPKKYRGFSYMTLKNDAKFEKKLTCSLENDRNFANSGSISEKQPFSISKQERYR